VPTATATVVRAVAAMVLATGLTACTPGEQPSEGPTEGSSATVPTLTGELTRYRRDEALRRLQVKLGQPEGEDPVEVESLSLTLPGYDHGPPSELDSTSRPGAAVDLPVQLGDAICPAAGGATTEDAVPDGPLVAVVTVAGLAEPVEIELTDPDGVGPQTWSRECSSLAALDAAALELGPAWPRGGAAGALTASGELVVGPVGDGRAVEVVELVGTTLFSASAALPVAAVAGETVSVPMTVTPARCDPHAVGESKRGYAFGVRVAVDGGEPVLVTVEPTEAARVQMEDVLLEQCGLG
jgi:hypothetical protein